MVSLMTKVSDQGTLCLTERLHWRTIVLRVQAEHLTVLHLLIAVRIFVPKQCLIALFLARGELLCDLELSLRRPQVIRRLEQVVHVHACLIVAQLLDLNAKVLLDLVTQSVHVFLDHLFVFLQDLVNLLALTVAVDLLLGSLLGALVK